MGLHPLVDARVEPLRPAPSSLVSDAESAAAAAAADVVAAAVAVFAAAAVGRPLSLSSLTLTTTLSAPPTSLCLLSHAFRFPVFPFPALLLFR